ncbi:hypothetical protein EUAN_23820 [Andreesenia angusta]|uniref:Uncharacterized protein n=1 Tax=Andreesenia angusta TaxID=39480 RepID=A0A1S1V415_9FIRM|nr:hypothetical protein [Andreesenia angusta]OHW61258.1 hypothetical protein EUAN_23820 [Andreesenia angusta]
MSIKGKLAANKGIMDGIKEAGEKVHAEGAKEYSSPAESNSFESILKKQSKPELIRATYYLRQDQIDSITEYSELSGKRKNEFLRDLLDAAFAELKKSQG